MPQKAGQMECDITCPEPGRTGGLTTLVLAPISDAQADEETVELGYQELRPEQFDS
jgi:hypothetical protein